MELEDASWHVNDHIVTTSAGMEMMKMMETLVMRMKMMMMMMID